VHIALADESEIDVVVGRWPRGSAGHRTRRAPGYIDRQDAAALFAIGERQALVQDVEAHIDDVRPSVRTLWQKLLASVSDA